MLLIYSLFYIFVRIYVFAKVFFLMWMTYYYPETYPISSLTWWMYFLIFDIWLATIIPNTDIKKPKNDKKDEILQ